MARVYDNNTTNFNPEGDWNTYRVDLDEDGYEANDTTDPKVNPFGKYKDPDTGKWIKASKTSYDVNPSDRAEVLWDQGLFDYGDDIAFANQVDNSIAGQMRDCAECHVGGGAMEYILTKPGTDLSQPDARISLRGINTTDVFDDGSKYTAYNKFIGQYEGYDYGKGSDVTYGDVSNHDYSQSGVLEMDCLLCHMKGYSWEARKEEIRLGKFDASRAVGAGIATGAVNGTAVTYDSSMVELHSDQLTLTSNAADNILASPSSQNCSFCHFDKHQVDWKKRGSYWTENMPYEAEVHKEMGCIGCHDPGSAIASDGGPPEGVSWTGKANGILGHDPAKGSAPFSSLWDNNDGKAIKTCEGCHVDQVQGNQGAPNPTAAHEAAGLTATLVQDGRDGMVDASHLDIIHCSACHVKKLSVPSGGAMVDSTGPDHEGRLTDHENDYVTRSMDNNLAYAWGKTKKKITPRNALITMFWKDFSESVDINNDGQKGGMDPVNPSHLRNIMRDNSLDALTQDGDITYDDIIEQKNALENGLTIADYGVNGSKSALKLSFMGVLFQANHNVSPADYAWGAGGCKDCHSENAGFYNGSYEIKPDSLTIDLTDAPVGPFTKVNGLQQPTDFHPTTFAKAQYGERSIAIQVASHKDGTTLRAVDKSEFLYEDNMTAAGGKARIGIDGNTYTTRSDFVEYLNNIGDNITSAPRSGIHNVHTDNGDYGLGISCTECHSGTTAAGDGTYDVNGDFEVDYKYPAGYNSTTEKTCTEWGIEDGNFTCEEWESTEPTGIMSCTTACHGTTGSQRYSGYQVEANFSALPSWSDNKATFNATQATCAAWREVNATHEQYDFVTEDNCTYEWSFEGSPEVTFTDTANSTAEVTWDSNGTYEASLTMTHKESDDTDTQNLDVTVPMEPYGHTSTHTRW